MQKLPTQYYLQDDVTALASSLIGKVLATRIKGEEVTSGFITETEAYEGVTDRASHAHGGRHTPRTATMFMQGGIAYIYLCYGIHHLFNVVTNREGIPHAVLIRGIQPLEGIDVMASRTAKSPRELKKINGPGKISKALGITTRLDRTPLNGSTIWISNNGLVVPEDKIKRTPRIGVDYAGGHARWPYRFYWMA